MSRRQGEGKHFHHTLQAGYQSLQPNESEVSKGRLKNIQRSLNRAILGIMVRYEINLDANIKLNDLNSEVVKILKKNEISQFSLALDFFSYDGDGLIGHVAGGLGASYH